LADIDHIQRVLYAEYQIKVNIVRTFRDDFLIQR